MNLKGVLSGNVSHNIGEAMVAVSFIILTIIIL